MEVLMILLILSISGIFLFVIYMNYLNKRIDKLEPKIEILQYQTDDVLHDIDVVNRNVIQYCASLKRLEDEKIDAEPNIESLWHDANDEPLLEGKEIIFLNNHDFAYITGRFGGTFSYMLEDYSWREYVNLCKITKWAYISDLLPKGGQK